MTGPLTLDEYERAIADLLDEMADVVPDGDPEDDEQRARRERIEARVSELLHQEAKKVDRMADILRRFDATAEECSDEANRLRARAKSFHNKRDALAGYIVDVMLRSGVKRLQGSLSTMTRIQNPETVEVDEVDTLPFGYQRIAVTLKPRTPEQLAKVKALLAAGIEGGIVVEADKVALKQAMATPGFDDPRVRLRPGTWRLALR